MAFTVAHMAAALPFYHSRRWLNFEALLIGTMMPDLPYFLNSAVSVGELSHRWMGLLSYCLPWGLLVFVLWYWLLKPAAIALMQPWYDLQLFDGQYIQQHQTLPPSRFRQIIKQVPKLGLWFVFWLKVILGLLLGAATHLIWDGMTHVDGFIAEQLAWLQYSVNINYLGDLTVARILQYLSSVMGLLLLLRFAWSKFMAQRITGLHLNRQAVEALSLFTQHLILKKWHSLWIVGLMSLSSLYWGIQAALKWHNLVINNQYLWIAKILVGLLQGGMGLFIIYAVAYQLLFHMRHPHLLRHKNYKR